MVRIEELPDDFDASLDLNASSAAPPSSARHDPPPPPSSKPQAGIPSSMIDQSLPFPDGKLQPASTLPPGAPSAPMPPAMANTKAHTADELLTMLNRTPLFMTELDETDGAGGENVDLEALKALAYEGTRAQVADGFRERGNECVAEKSWRDARDFYTRALAHLAAPAAAAASRRTAEGKLDGGEGAAEVDWADRGDVPEDWSEEKEAALARATQEKCHVNRALCNLELRNYGSVNRDCAAVVTINPRNVKALYRGALACFRLEKLDAAEDAVRRCLVLDAENKAARELSGKIEARQRMVAKLEAERREREQKKRRELAVLRTALKARGWALRMTKNKPDVEDATLELTEKHNPASMLKVPVLVLYPTAGQSELIKGVEETHSLNDHLEYILPAPFDEKGDFGGSDAKRVECFAEKADGGLAKIGKKLLIGEVLKGGKILVEDGLWRVFVVPVSKTQDWIADWKKMKGKAG